MNGIDYEFKNGFTWPYLIIGFIKTLFVGSKYLVPEYGLAGRLFSIGAERIKDETGSRNPDEMIKDIVTKYAKSRGDFVKNTVLSRRRTLSLRNMLIYTDLNTKNFKSHVSIKNNDLVIKITACEFYDCACSSGYKNCADYYCMYEDDAFKSGYNDSIEIDVEPKYKSLNDYCTITYTVKGKITSPVAEKVDDKETIPIL